MKKMFLMLAVIFSTMCSTAMAANPDRKTATEDVVLTFDGNTMKGKATFYTTDKQGKTVEDVCTFTFATPISNWKQSEVKLFREVHESGNLIYTLVVGDKEYVVCMKSAIGNIALWNSLVKK